MVLAQEQLAINPAVSAEIAQAILGQFPNTYDALLVLAAAKMALGDNDGAAQVAKQAFAVAPKGPARYQAARLVSSAHFRANHHSRAEWWLRKALNNATNAQMEQAVQRDFQVVRQANPLTVNLGFSLAPNSNINNGSSSDTVTLLGSFVFSLNVDARPLAGIEASTNVDLKYRLSEAQNHSTVAGLTLFGRTFELTAAAQADVAAAAATARATAQALALASGATPAQAAAAGQDAANATTVTGSDYAFSVAEVSLKHTQQFEAFPGPSSVALNIGANWYGGDPYTYYSRLSLTQDFGLSPRTNLQLSLSGTHQVSIRDGDVPSDILSLGSSINHVLGNGDRLGFSVNLQQTQSPDVTLENTGIQTQISYQIARPVWGMALSGNISAGTTDFPVSSYGLNGRMDETYGIGLTAVFVNLSYFGFSPSLSLEASRTQSSIDFFDRESAGIRFGIQSTF